MVVLPSRFWPIRQLYLHCMGAPEDGRPSTGRFFLMAGEVAATACDSFALAAPRGWDPVAFAEGQVARASPGVAAPRRSVQTYRPGQQEAMRPCPARTARWGPAVAPRSPRSSTWDRSQVPALRGNRS